MKAYNDTKYPIFEADQVLSQNHLNNIVSYLEEQDRLTRTGLIGIGRICGMDVSFPEFNSVQIDCGTGVTSLGFQINWEEKKFSCYKNIQLSNSFLSPDITNESFLKPIFDQANKYTPFKNCIELIYIDEATLNNPSIPLPDGVSIIPDASFFNNKVIMMLLETSLIDVKKCVETNCDDKGKKLEFKIRTLLVDFDKIPEIFINKYFTSTLDDPLYIERFNVPQTSIVAGQQVLNTFYGMLNATLVNRVSDAFKSLYRKFGTDYEDTITDFIILNNAASTINTVIKSYRSSLSIQYVLRWMGDLVDAYNEIYQLNEQFLFTNCCSENAASMFPLNIFLGRVLTKTALLTGNNTIIAIPDNIAVRRRYVPNQYNVLDTDQNYITPWLKIASESAQNGQTILRGLLERIIHILNNFSVPSAYSTASIKITPSVLGNYALSEKSIPYYYNNVSTLNRLWSPEKTLKGENTRIFSYNAASYTTYQPTLQPFNYDFEPSNFLRIEGHIGKLYDEVVTTVLNIKNTYRLPFNVIAVNAIDFTTAKLSITSYKGDWGNIQLDYEIVSRHWEDVIGKKIQWFEANKSWIVSKNFLNDSEVTALINYMKKGRNMTYKLFSDFLPLYSVFITNYETLEERATIYRQKLFDDMTLLQFDPKTNESFTKLPFEPYIEDLIDHLDDIVEVRSLGQFRALYQNAQEKWKSISTVQTLKDFVDKHPGIEHKCGVPVGGTWVLVYQDKSVLQNQQTIGVKSTTIKRTVVLNPTLSDYNTKVLSFAAATFDGPTYTNFAAYINKTSFFENIRDTVSIPDKTVIADFYLPYLCGTDGPIINFVVNPPDFEPQGMADFDKPDFNSSDFFAKEEPVA